MNKQTPTTSTARIRRNVERVVNADVNKKIAEIEKLPDTDPEKTFRLEALKSARDRFSSAVVVAFGAVADTIIRDILDFAIKRGISAGKHIIGVSHLYCEALTKEPFYLLIRDLPAARKEMLKHLIDAENEMMDKHARDIVKEFIKSLTDMKAPEKNALKAKFAEFHKKKIAAVVEEPEAVEEPVVSDETTVSYDHYVGQIYKDLKASPEFAPTKLSQGLKSHLAELLAQFFDRFAGMINIMLGYAKVKTISRQLCEEIIALVMSPDVPFIPSCELKPSEDKDGVSRFVATKVVRSPDNSYFEKLRQVIDSMVSYAESERKAKDEAKALKVKEEVPEVKDEPAQ